MLRSEATKYGRNTSIEYKYFIATNNDDTNK